MGFDGRTNKTLLLELNQVPPSSVVAAFGYDELCKLLAGPLVKILDRDDHNSVLQFLLLEMRSAVYSAWLENLTELRCYCLQMLHRNICIYAFSIQ